jgi:hypothetical protein
MHMYTYLLIELPIRQSIFLQLYGTPLHLHHLTRISACTDRCKYVYCCARIHLHICSTPNIHQYVSQKGAHLYLCIRIQLHTTSTHTYTDTPHMGTCTHTDPHRRTCICTNTTSCTHSTKGTYMLVHSNTYTYTATGDSPHAYLHTHKHARARAHTADARTRPNKLLSFYVSA